MGLLLVSCDGGSSGSEEASSDRTALDDGRSPAPLLADNGLENITTDASNAAFPKRVYPDLEAGFNVSLFSPQTGNAYDQYQIPVNRTGGMVYVSYDMMGAGLQGNTLGFSLLFDTPSVRVIRVDGGSSSVFRVYGSGSRTLQSYDDNTFYKVEHEIDLTNNSWVIYINDEVVHSSTFSSTSIYNIRLSLGQIGAAYDPNIRVDIQNFTVSNSPVR